MLEFGLLPKEYNVRVHGAYFPGYYYGKPDTPLLDVKLGELPAWLSRRSRNPADWARAISRFAKTKRLFNAIHDVDLTGLLLLPRCRHKLAM
ncbi:F-type H+-transporting ATPase subunit f [Paragonimus westermani]|uniref:F-type H+-transporting ATPase subunit f n=1 Tax=Paragonimus westermani TaxID=34504 RepID=A0A5J4P0M9_9TREM|nr:F-type H+-transporting ATPase subunit f [Paragonimus westermani]